jgi:hypothetical protein
MPKTGNSTLRATSAYASSEDGVWSSHFLSDASILRESNQIHLYPESTKSEVISELKKALSLQNVLKTTGFYNGYESLKIPIFKSYKIPILCGLRDPWRLLLSSVFYQYRNEPALGMKKLEEALTFGMEYWISAQDYWFDTDFIPVTGFNPFGHSFDREKGYSIYETDSFRILLIRTEWFFNVLPVAIEELLSIPAGSIKILNQNLGAERSEGTQYKHVCKSFQPNRDILKRMYESRFAKQFLMESERSSSLSLSMREL